MIFSSDYEYIKAKTEILESCDCKNNQMCGICFWKGITIPPEIGKNNKCLRCLADTKTFKLDVDKTTGGFIEFEYTCTIHCIWWDWFNYLRTQYAKQNNVKFESVPKRKKV